MGGRNTHHDVVDTPLSDDVSSRRGRDRTEDDESGDGDSSSETDGENVVVLGPPGEVSLLDVDLGDDKPGQPIPAPDAETRKKETNLEEPCDNDSRIIVGQRVVRAPGKGSVEGSDDMDLGDDRLGPLPSDEPEDDGEETTDTESPEEGSVDSAERCEGDDRSARGAQQRRVRKGRTLFRRLEWGRGYPRRP